MLKHYSRVREQDFRQVFQHKSDQNQPCNVGGHFDSVESPVLCNSPAETRTNEAEKLAVYSTVYMAEMGGIERQAVEMSHVSTIPQLLEITAQDGNTWQEVESYGSYLFYQNGEDRIARRCRKFFMHKWFGKY